MRERWNDYGIGLLLQGDLRGAEAAFLKVTEMEPGYADGCVNVARVRVQEGAMAEAETMLRKALEVDPKLAKTHFFLGRALKALGRYDEALEHHAHAAAQYPRDRVVREPDRARAVPEAPVPGGDGRAAEASWRSIPRTCRRTTT